jgi:hypothetical protein
MAVGMVSDAEHAVSELEPRFSIFRPVTVVTATGSKRRGFGRAWWPGAADYSAVSARRRWRPLRTRPAKACWPG